MTVAEPLTAGSPRYLALLAHAADVADDNTDPDAIELGLWDLFDDGWELVTKHPTTTNLSRFAAVGMALLRGLTGTPIPHLAARATELHVRKNAGYAGMGNVDPWANFRLSTFFGVTPFEGVLVRMSDKYIRSQNLRHNAANEQVGESLADTVSDAIAYALIARCLLEEDGGLS